MNTKIAIPVIALIPAAAVPSVLLSQSNTTPTDFGQVEVNFYDKDKTNTKKIRLYIDSLEGSSSFEFYDDNDTNNNKGKKASYIEESDKQLYQKLFSIGSKYIQTQNNLNLIKLNSSDGDEDTFLNNNKCCPNAQGSTTCNCKDQGECCSMCLACYADNSSSGSTTNCCAASSTCTGDNFKKTQKTFGYLKKNLYSAYSNIYLSPMQANIKFMDVSFDEIKSALSSASSSSQKEFKNFVGSLVYGFVDYSYKSTEYKNNILDSKNDYIDLTDNSKDHYFYNIPQKFSFLYKEGSKKEGSKKEDNQDIELINKEVKEVPKEISKYKNFKIDSSNCCDQKTTKDEIIKCLLRRNYISLEKNSKGLTNIADKIKNTKEGCCSNATGSSG